MSFRIKNRADKERGAILLTTLLVMGLMATLAVAMMDDVRFGMKRTGNVQSNAQAQWYAIAAQDFSRAYLQENVAKIKPRHLNPALLTMATSEPIIFPIEGGAISLSVRGGSQCVSLGSLASAPGQRQMSNLLIALGHMDADAKNLVAAAIDWQDADDQIQPSGGAEDGAYLGLSPAYRTPNTAFSSVMELRALRGMDEKIYQSLRPFICARPKTETAKININGLSLEQAPVLASVLGPNQLELAAQLISQRPPAGYTSYEGLKAAPAMEGAQTKNIDFDNIIYLPEYIWVEAQILYQGARRSVVIDYAISGGKTRPVYRSYSQQARRPIIEVSDISEGVSGEPL
ncbi:MAG: type II secretion system minor pseudopilin GspK [Robiginitomaculum sp.]